MVPSCHFVLSLQLPVAVTVPTVACAAVEMKRLAMPAATAKGIGFRINVSPAQDQSCLESMKDTAIR
jgi:hypothetical protein